MNHVLIADDSEDLLEMLSFVFKRRSISLLTANSKDSLDNQLNRVIPDLIIIDAIFNDADGRELCKELKSNTKYKDTPIILMSGNPVLLKDYKTFLADDVLEKPFLAKDLFSKISEFTKEN